ncbi:MAG: cobalamin-independent methionine synthase II family protein [Alphaproteobacteria bacterium]|nr:cobalamin-independent methionine synthase II family protein [Alphaproteobacteria bacterium]
MTHSVDRILTTHVGSLVRPPALADFYRRMRDGEPCDEAAFRQCLETSVTEVVRQQAGIGIDIVSDGEFGKTQTWSRYVLDRLNGFEFRRLRPGEAASSGAAALTGRDRELFPEFYAEWDKTQDSVLLRAPGRWVCNGAISYRGQALIGRDIDNLKRGMAAAKIPSGFLPVVAPGSVVPERADEHYASDEAYTFAVAEALRSEYRAIINAGLILQVDDAHLTGAYERIVPPGTLADYRKWAEMRVAALNHALQDIPEERCRYHICWGSWSGPHVADVQLKDIADLLLRVRAGCYSIEGANARHEHEWRVWEKVKLPAGKVLMPGVVSHHTNVVEHPELVAQRLVRLARLVGRENVIAGTDCGFAQGPLVRRVHPTIMWAKLGSLVEGARIASLELWGAKAA